MNCASKNFTMLFLFLTNFHSHFNKEESCKVPGSSKTVFNCLLCRNTFCMCSTSFGHREIYILSFSLIQPTLNQQYQIKNCYKIKMQHLHLLAYFSNTSLCHLVESLSTLHQNQPNVELMLTFNKSI